ncbi:MAG: hypothetical protein V8R52_07530 [Coprobacter fastidiosus]
MSLELANLRVSWSPVLDVARDARGDVSRKLMVKILISLVV